jgi:hypothetical protein
MEVINEETLADSKLEESKYVSTDETSSIKIPR